MINVNKLKPKPDEVFLGEIVFNDSLYPRKSAKTENIERLVEVLRLGREFHDPIIIEANTKNLLDGQHRLSAYKLFYGDSTWPETKVKVKTVELPQDEFPLGWLMYAAKLNNDHGLPLTRSEQRRNLAKLQKKGLSQEAIVAYADQVFSMSVPATEAFLSQLSIPKEKMDDGEKLAVGVERGVKLAIKHISGIKSQLAKGAKLSDNDRADLEKLSQALDEILA